MRSRTIVLFVLLSLSCHRGLKKSIAEVNSLMSAGKFEEAATKADSALQKYPGEPELLEPQVRALLQAGRLTDARIAYVQLRAKSGDKNDILTQFASSTLIDASKDPEEIRRKYLLVALERNPGAYAVDPLLNVLTDEKIQTRIQAIRILGIIPGVESQNALTKLLEDTSLDATLQIAVAAALLRKGEEVGKPQLEAALDGKNELRAVIAARAFADIGDSRGLKVVEKALGSKDEIVALGALSALGVMDGKLVVKSLQKALTDPRASIRTEAARSAGVQGSKELVPFLRKLLSDPDPKVKQTAAFSLGALSDKESADTLRKLMLEDADPSVKLNAAQALRRMEDDLGFQFVYDIVQNGGNPTLRALMLEDMGQLGDSTYIKEVRAAVKDTDPLVRAAALIALGQLQDEEAGKLSISCAGDQVSDVRLAVARTLAVVDSKDAAAALASLLGDEEILVRMQASISWLSRQQ